MPRQSAQFRSLDPYQSTRPFEAESEPFDFARDGRRIEELLGNSQRRKREMWEPPIKPEFTQNSSPQFEMDPMTRMGQDFKAGASEDDPIFGLLGSGLESSGDDPVDWGVNTVANWAKDKSPSRLMGSIASSFPMEEAKAGLLAGKAALLGGKAALGKGGVSMAAVPLARIRGMATRMGHNNPAMINAVDQFNRQYPNLDETQAKSLIDLFGNINQSPLAWTDVQWGMRGSQPRELLDLAQNANPQNFDEHVDRAADIMHSITREPPQKRRTGRMIVGGGPSMNQAPPEPILYPHLITLEDYINEPYTDLGRLGYGGFSPKRMLATADDERIMHKGSPFWPNNNPGDLRRPSQIALIPEHLMLREEAASKFHRRINKRTPEQTAVAQGGLVSRMDQSPGLMNWAKLDNNEKRLAGQDPTVLKQIYEELVGDTLGFNWDTHGNQFMYDPNRKLFVGVDKGESELSRHLMGTRAHPQEFYGDELSSLGRFGSLARQTKPMYDDVIGQVKQIPEADFRSILDPWMKNSGGNMSASDQDTVTRNLMQWINDPVYWDELYRKMVR